MPAPAPAGSIIAAHMCAAYPGLVVAVDATGALIRGELRDYRAATLLVPDVAPGDYVVVAAGTILERLEPEEAAEIRALIDTARGIDRSTVEGLHEARSRA